MHVLSMYMSAFVLEFSCGQISIDSVSAYEGCLGYCPFNESVLIMHVCVFRNSQRGEIWEQYGANI